MNFFIEIITGYSYAIKVYFLYQLIINIITFLLMSIDKKRAKKDQWRIKESTFMILALLGGAVGVLLGIVVFHHKQSKKKFYLGVPILYVINKIGSIMMYHYLLR